MELKKIPAINVGVVGHIDHGKTTLLRCLSGKFTDTHSEELKRGITIKLGYSQTTIYEENGILNNKKGKPIRYVSFIDAPGHEMLMATMLSGAAIIDAAILVVAANEGIKPQTKEHLMALQAKKIKKVIIVQNKIDLITKEQAIENFKKIREFVKNTIAENSPIIPISAQQGVNIEKIFEELVKMEIPDKDLNSEPVFLVARSFDINRPGKKIPELNGGVLGGILKKGKLKIGDEIEIKPGIILKKAHHQSYQTIYTKILSINEGSEKIKEAVPGVSISIETELDPSVTKSDSLTGCVVSKKGALPEISSKAKIKYELFDEVFGAGEKEKVEPIKTKEMLMLSVNTTITVGTVENLKGNEIEFYLNIPIVPLTGDNVGIARNFKGHWRLIGWGEILN